MALGVAQDIFHFKPANPVKPRAQGSRPEVYKKLHLNYLNLDCIFLIFFTRSRVIRIGNNGICFSVGVLGAISSTSHLYMLFTNLSKRFIIYILFLCNNNVIYISSSIYQNSCYVFCSIFLCVHNCYFLRCYIHILVLLNSLSKI